MLFFLIRVLLAPLAVIAGTLAQRRFGYAVSGLILGLLSPVFLSLVGRVAARYRVRQFNDWRASCRIHRGSGRALALRPPDHSLVTGPRLVGALGAFALAAGAVNLLKLSALLAGLITAIGFAAALRWWPVTQNDNALHQERSRLWLRVTLSAVFTIVIVALAGRLGPVLAGLIDALPAMSLMMAFYDSPGSRIGASSRFLHGVTRGSFSYLAAMIVLAELLRTGNLLFAFAAALAAALVVQGSIQAHDTLMKRTRVFVPSDEMCSQSV